MDGCTKKYVDKLQTLQFHGKKVIYQYSINGEKIANKDESNLHSELGLMLLENRPKRHLLNMMFDLKTNKPKLLTVPRGSMVLRSIHCIHFNEERKIVKYTGKVHM